MGEKGEKGEKGGDDGEKKKEGGGGGGGGKDGNAPVILKADLHCEGCALKVKRAIKGIEGVEGVSLDMGSDKITVRGNADPWEIKEKIEAKTAKKAAILSPANPPKKAKKKNDNNNTDEKAGDGKKKKNAAAAAAADVAKESSEKKADDKKPKKLPVSTVVLKIRLHCEGCVDRIKRNISKIKGVEEVKVDAAKDQVTVRGTMDAKSLPGLLKDKLKRGVDVVVPSKDGDKKEKGGGGGDKENEKKGGGGGGEKSPASAPPMAAWGEPSRFDYYPPYGYGYGYGLRIEMAHAPQLFSDENPNACAVM